MSERKHEDFLGNKFLIIVEYMFGGLCTGAVFHSNTVLYHSIPLCPYHSVSSWGVAESDFLVQKLREVH